MKYCSRCKKEKPLDSFYLRTLKSKNISRQPKCKDCSKALNVEYYARNPDLCKKSSSDNSKNNTRENRVKVVNYLIEHGCVDCGERDPVVLEFDHLKDKKFTISRKISRSWVYVKEEIDKCEVRCSNCHRRKTAKERNWYSYLKYDESGKAYYTGV